MVPADVGKMDIPFLYRFVFLYFEPFAAFFGTLINLFNPISFLQTMSPAATSSTIPSPQVLHDQLAALLFLFAWFEAVVLRSTKDVSVWKAVLFGMFLCDVLHLFASYRELGIEVFLDPGKWRAQEWVNFIMLYGPGSLRLAFCAGIGLNGPTKTVKQL